MNCEKFKKFHSFDLFYYVEHLDLKKQGNCLKISDLLNLLTSSIRAVNNDEKKDFQAKPTRHQVLWSLGPIWSKYFLFMKWQNFLSFKLKLIIGIFVYAAEIFAVYLISKFETF